MRAIVARPQVSDKERRIAEQVVHFFQWAVLGLGKEGPEEDCVGEVANLQVSS
jgi:hypothetical protein